MMEILLMKKWLEKEKNKLKSNSLDTDVCLKDSKRIILNLLYEYYKVNNKYSF